MKSRRRCRTRVAHPAGQLVQGFGREEHTQCIGEWRAVILTMHVSHYLLQIDVNIYVFFISAPGLQINTHTHTYTHTHTHTHAHTHTHVHVRILNYYLLWSHIRELNYYDNFSTAQQYAYHSGSKWSSAGRKFDCVSVYKN